jgi:hypothetical protein
VLQLPIHPLLPYTSHPSPLLFSRPRDSAPPWPLGFRSGTGRDTHSPRPARMMGVEEVGNKMQSQMRLDAAAGGGGRRPPPPGPLRQGVPAPLSRLQLLARPGSVPHASRRPSLLLITVGSGERFAYLVGFVVLSRTGSGRGSTCCDEQARPLLLQRDQGRRLHGQPQVPARMPPSPFFSRICVYSALVSILLVSIICGNPFPIAL